MPLRTDITVMYVNPVGNSDYDQVFADMIEEFKYPSTDAYVVSLNPATVPPKITNLEYRTYESFIMNDTLKAARFCTTNDVDSMIIGCFYDPGLYDCREICYPTVVVAPCQSSIQAAMTLANNFSIIIGETKWEDQMKQAVYDYGYRDKLASFQTVGLRVEDFHVDPALTKKLLEEAAITAVRDHHAESIILGCTLEVGFYQDLITRLAGEFNTYIPVIDPSIASFKAAEHAALRIAIGWGTSNMWGMQPPPEAELLKFEILQTPYVFGHQIRIPPTLPAGEPVPPALNIPVV